MVHQRLYNMNTVFNDHHQYSLQYLTAVPQTLPVRAIKCLHLLFLFLLFHMELPLTCVLISRIQTVGLQKIAYAVG